MTKDTFTRAMSGMLFLSGVVVGAAGGLLLAPQSGVRTRRQLRNLADDIHERASTIASDTRKLVAGALDSGKRVVGLS